MTEPTAETVCPRCCRSGFVHVQRVIRGDETFQMYRCTACDYEWEEDRGLDHEATDTRKDGSR